MWRCACAGVCVSACACVCMWRGCEAYPFFLDATLALNQSSRSNDITPWVFVLKRDHPRVSFMTDLQVLCLLRAILADADDEAFPVGEGHVLEGSHAHGGEEHLTQGRGCVCRRGCVCEGAYAGVCERVRMSECVLRVSLWILGVMWLSKVVAGLACGARTLLGPIPPHCIHALSQHLSKNDDTIIIMHHATAMATCTVWNFPHSSRMWLPVQVEFACKSK